MYETLRGATSEFLSSPWLRWSDAGPVLAMPNLDDFRCRLDRIIRTGARQMLQADEAAARQCILVLMGATADGTKELIAVVDGFRESEQSLSKVLIDLKQLGLRQAPPLAVGDGALGFWAALRKVFPTTREQRCRVHKTANLLNKMPKSLQPKTKADLHEIWLSDTRAAAGKAYDMFLENYGQKYDGACECPRKDRGVLLTSYDFPPNRRTHLRTTNPIESAFATIRLRHRRTKGSGSRRTR